MCKSICFTNPSNNWTKWTKIQQKVRNKLSVLFMYIYIYICENNAKVDIIVPHNQLLTRAIVNKCSLYLMETIYRKRFLIIISSTNFRIKKIKRTKKKPRERQEKRNNTPKKFEYMWGKRRVHDQILHFKHTSVSRQTHILSTRAIVVVVIVAVVGFRWLLFCWFFELRNVTNQDIRRRSKVPNECEYLHTHLYIYISILCISIMWRMILTFLYY